MEQVEGIWAVFLSVAKKKNILLGKRAKNKETTEDIF